MGEAFRGIIDGDGGSGAESTVNGPITATTEQFYELQITVVDDGAKRGRRGKEASAAAIVTNVR